MSRCFGTKGSVFSGHRYSSSMATWNSSPGSQLGTIFMQPCESKSLEIGACVPCGPRYFPTAALAPVEGKTGNWFTAVVQERNMSPHPCTRWCNGLQPIEPVVRAWVYRLSSLKSTSSCCEEGKGFELRFKKICNVSLALVTIDTECRTTTNLLYPQRISA
jgi:hypothetical protein